MFMLEVWGPSMLKVEGWQLENWGKEHAWGVLVFGISAVGGVGGGAGERKGGGLTIIVVIKETIQPRTINTHVPRLQHPQSQPIAIRPLRLAESGDGRVVVVCGGGEGCADIGVGLVVGGFGL